MWRSSQTMIARFSKAFEPFWTGLSFEANYACHSSTDRRWFKLVARPFESSNRFALITHRNITSTKLAIERIEDALDIRDHLAAVVQTSADAIISFDLDGVVTAWNPAAEELYGYRSKEIAGRSLETIYPDERRSHFQSYIDDIVAGRVRRYQVTRRHKDGHDIDVEIAAAPIVSGGRIVGISNVHRLASVPSQTFASLCS